MQRKEVDGACWQWVSMKITAREMLDAKGDKKMIPFLLEGKSNDPEVRNLPKFSDYIKGKENRAAFKAWMGSYRFFRPIALPPRTPTKRLNILRTAFKKTLEDPEFLALARKIRLFIRYVPGQEVEKHIKATLATPAGAKAKLRSIIGN
tara:strand:+ start:34 stop:480 length:447 start_codon:yes stop_codon:yes gene_type:complete